MLRIHVCDDVIDTWKGVFKMLASLPPSLYRLLLHHGWIYLEREDIMKDIMMTMQRLKNWLLTSYTCVSWGDRYYSFDKQFHFMYVVAKAHVNFLVHCQQMIKREGFVFIVNKCSPSRYGWGGHGLSYFQLIFTWFFDFTV